MAWIEKKKRGDGGVSARVVWRLGGGRDGSYQSETFSAGTDAQNLARADGFKKMVDAAGQRWPDGWVRGEGFVRPAGTDPLTAPPRFVDIGERYVRQIVDLSPGQRKRYLGHLKVLADVRVRGALVFCKPVAAITEADLREWLIDWDRSLKTKATYHGLIHGVFAYAMKLGYLISNPGIGTAPRMSRVKQSRPELRFLTERELETAVRLAGVHGELVTVAVGTGMRFGELGALWVSDVDLERRTIRVNKAWKRNGEDEATETPGWLAKQLKPKHAMREHHLGMPKTAKSRRTITISPAAAAVLGRRILAKAPDDFVFTTRSGLPLHNGDFNTHVWRKLMKALAAVGIPRFRFHDYASHPRRLAGGRWRAAAPHPGPARPRVDHDHNRHLRSPAPRGRRIDLWDHRHRSDWRHHPAEQRSVVVATLWQAAGYGRRWRWTAQSSLNCTT